VGQAVREVKFNKWIVVRLGASLRKRVMRRAKAAGVPLSVFVRGLLEKLKEVK